MLLWSMISYVYFTNLFPIAANSYPVVFNFFPKGIIEIAYSGSLHVNQCPSLVFPYKRQPDGLCHRGHANGFSHNAANEPLSSDI